MHARPLSMYQIGRAGALLGNAPSSGARPRPGDGSWALLQAPAGAEAVIILPEES